MDFDVSATSKQFASYIPFKFRCFHAISRWNFFDTFSLSTLSGCLNMTCQNPRILLNLWLIDHNVKIIYIFESSIGRKSLYLIYSSIIIHETSIWIVLLKWERKIIFFIFQNHFGFADLRITQANTSTGPNEAVREQLRSNSMAIFAVPNFIRD